MPHWQDSCLRPGPPQWFQSGKLLTSPLFSLDREAVLARGPAPDQVERDALDQCHVARTILRAQALVVVAEDDIQNPINRIFNRPMTPDGPQELVRRQGPRGDVVAGERRDLAAPHDRAVHGGDRLEPGPGRLAAEPGRGRHHRAAPVLLTPMRSFHTLAALRPGQAAAVRG